MKKMTNKKALTKIFVQHTRQLAADLKNVKDFHGQVLAVVEQLNEAFNNGHKVLIAGNGGSATLAEHLSDEMVGRYKTNRRPYPVIALTADSAVLTCIGNDFGYEQVFGRQVEALGEEGDIFIGLSTSGNSANILRAADAAREHGLTVIAFTGKKGKLKDLADYAITTPGDTTARIQERDLHAIHLICEAFEEPALLGGSFHEGPEITPRAL